MLAVTKAALQKLAQRLDRRGASEGMSLRFTRREGGWALCLDHEAPGDMAFSHEGRKVLLLDADASAVMQHMTLRTEVVGRRSRLKLRRRTRDGE